MNKSIERIQATIEPLRQQIINHPVYGVIESIEDLRIFMQYHVFAVWDFMSLLKALQNNLTCTSVPWFPTGDATTRHLINEIVVGEESDVDEFGNRKSHFELYLEAMQQCGASTASIDRFIASLKETGNFEKAYAESAAPSGARRFVDFTFEIINSQEAHLQAGIFTFGREDLIPSMFLAIIKDMALDFPEQVSIFKYYMERHIEVDGDHHSHLALEMTALLCQDDEQKWAELETAISESLKQRIQLWNEVYNEICKTKAIA